MCRVCLNNSFDFFRSSALFANGNNITGAQQVRSNVYAVAVNLKMAMTNQLLCLGSGGCKTNSVYYIV